MRPQFDEAGARLVVVSAVDTGAQEFKDAVWPGGELWIDDDEAFKKALGGTPYKLWWLLKPSVLKQMVGYARKYGTATADNVDPKTQLLGGTFVVKDGEVVHVHRETSTFDNGSAKELLAAVVGKQVSELPATPRQSEVVEACSRAEAVGGG